MPSKQRIPRFFLVLTAGAVLLLAIIIYPVLTELFLATVLAGVVATIRTLVEDMRVRLFYAASGEEAYLRGATDAATSVLPGFTAQARATTGRSTCSGASRGASVDTSALRAELVQAKREHRNLVRLAARLRPAPEPPAARRRATRLCHEGDRAAAAVDGGTQIHTVRTQYGHLERDEPACSAPERFVEPPRDHLLAVVCGRRIGAEAEQLGGGADGRAGLALARLRRLLGVACAAGAGETASRRQSRCGCSGQ